MSTITNKQFGVGISYRPVYKPFLSAHADVVDCLEVFPEHFMQNGKVIFAHELAKLMETFPVVLHGLTSTVVSTSRPDKEYLRVVKQLLKFTGSPYFSDHAAMTATDGFSLGHLCPNVYDEGVLKRAISNVKMLEEELQVPVVLEYTTQAIRIPSKWTEEQFYLELANAVPEMGLLVDLSNVWYNSMNFEFDAKEFISSLPAERIVHIHLAGGHQLGSIWIDSHSQPVNVEVFDLLEFVCSRTTPNAIIIERDTNYEAAFEDLQGDLSHARSIMHLG